MNALFAAVPSTSSFDLWLLTIAVFGGAITVGTPYLFVSLGECITERAGRVNLGLEGTLFMGAMSGYFISFLTKEMIASNSALLFLCPWLGVLAAALVGAVLGVMHALACNLPRVNFVAFGIAMMVFGKGLAKCLGKSCFGKSMISEQAPQMSFVDFGWWTTYEPLRNALRMNALFLVGVLLTVLLAWMLINTPWGMVLRLAGESEEAASAMGYSVQSIRIAATAMGGFLAGIAGSFLSLYSPGVWSDSISSGQGLMAVALVIFARWNPINCFWAALLFGGAGSLGAALQGQGLSSGAVAYLWDTAPYVLTLVIMVATSSRDRAMLGAPGVLTKTS